MSVILIIAVVDGKIDKAKKLLSKVGLLGPKNLTSADRVLSKYPVDTSGDLMLCGDDEVFETFVNNNRHPTGAGLCSYVVCNGSGDDVNETIAKTIPDKICVIKMTKVIRAVDFDMDALEKEIVDGDTTSEYLDDLETINLSGYKTNKRYHSDLQHEAKKYLVEISWHNLIEKKA